MGDGVQSPLPERPQSPLTTPMSVTTAKSLRSGIGEHVGVFEGFYTPVFAGLVAGTSVCLECR